MARFIACVIERVVREIMLDTFSCKVKLSLMKDPVEEALRQVREMQTRMLQKQRFKGYSGRARAMGGCFCLLMALWLGATGQTFSPLQVLYAWAAVFLLAASLNFGALIYWFLGDPEVGRDWRRLRPLGAVLPGLAAGAILTLALARHGEYGLLYGVWMLIFGVANFASRAVLPRGIQWAGAFYMAAGAVFLLTPVAAFTAPLAPALVFFAGEWLSGFILHFDERSNNTLLAFFGLPNRNHE